MESKVLICIPTRGFIHYKIASFIAGQAERGFPHLFACSSYGVAEARRSLASTFLRFDYSHMFFMDDDMLPPANVIARLLSAGADIVTADYFISQEGKVLSHCQDPEPQAGRFLTKIKRCGLGACLIRREVIEKCSNDFQLKYNKFGEVILSEDYYFCDAASAKGYNIFCDFEIKCQHLKMLPIGGDA